MNGIRPDDRILDAAFDYKFLLSKGYPQKPALDLVATRYSLSRGEKLLLYRCIHSDDYVKEVSKKVVCGKLNNYILFVDFYNVLISVVTALRGGGIYVCDDCVPRDLRGSKLNKSDSPYIEDALSVIAQTIKVLEPQQVVAVIDKNVSFSRSHAVMFENKVRLLGIKCLSELVMNPDRKLIDYSGSNSNHVVATSDSIVMLHSLRIAPITLSIINMLNVKPVYDFANIFNPDCAKCFNDYVKIIDKDSCGNT